jgi:hypothetical protein
MLMMNTLTSLSALFSLQIIYSSTSHHHSILHYLTIHSDHHSEKWHFYKDNVEGNTGVYFVKSNPATITLFSIFLKEEAPKKPDIDDQTIWWEYLRHVKFENQTGLDLVALPYCRDFSYSGAVRSNSHTPNQDSPNNNNNNGNGNLLQQRHEATAVHSRDPDITISESKHFSFDLKRKIEASRAIMSSGGDLTSYRLPVQSITTNRISDKENGKKIKEHILVTCPLDSCVFSAGALRGVAYKMLEDGLRRRHDSSVTIHANYLKDNGFKMGAMMKYGLWISDLSKVIDKPLSDKDDEKLKLKDSTGHGRVCHPFNGVKTCKDEPRICQKSQQVSHPVYKPGMGQTGRGSGHHAGHMGGQSRPGV